MIVCLSREVWTLKRKPRAAKSRIMVPGHGESKTQETRQKERGNRCRLGRRLQMDSTGRGMMTCPSTVGTMQKKCVVLCWADPIPLP